MAEDKIPFEDCEYLTLVPKAFAAREPFADGTAALADARRREDF